MNDSNKTDKAKGGLFNRLSKTRERLSSGLKNLLGGAPKLDDALFDEVEEQLILADLGVSASTEIVETLRTEARSQRIATGEDLLNLLRLEVQKVFDNTVGAPFGIEKHLPFVIMMVGVNGVGKTTTTAKLAHRLSASGHSVVLAAADTFRAAAVEQLQTWGERLNVPVIAQQHGADAAAVAHDALTAAIARQCDVLIVDTAGRQHTHGDLMEQLKKVKRVISKVMPDAPHEVLLTVDAGSGQNVLSQYEHFNAAVDVSGVCVTKLDGTAKGGVIVALTRQHDVPIRFIGIGEGVDDLRDFDPAEFVDALIPDSL